MHASRRTPPGPPGLLVLALIGTLLGCSPGGEPEFPEKPMKIICPWSQGGGTSTVSQLMASLIEQETGKPCNVIHRTGGRGVTGHQAGARATPDGHELAMITVEIAMLHWSGDTEIGPAEFEPIALINRDAAALFVRTDAPWQDLASLKREIETGEGKLKASGTALGGIWHVALAGGLLAMGLEANAVDWIPSKGSSPAIAELLAGGIQILVCSLPEAKAVLASGSVRCLGHMGDERLGAYPEVPTWKEQGIDWAMGGWRGLALPRGVPPARVREVERLIGTIIRGEEFRQRITDLGYLYSVEDARGFGETIRVTDSTMSQVIPRVVGSGSAGGSPKPGAAATAGAGDDRVPGPWFFPITLGAGMLALLILMAIFPGTPASGEASGAVRPVAGWSWKSGGLFLEVLAGAILYILLVETLGFILVAGALSLHLFRRLGASWIGACGAAGVLAPCVYLVFADLLRVGLPPGLIGW